MAKKTEKAEFLEVASPDEYTRFQLSKLRRVGQIQWPVLLEKEAGQAKLGKLISLTLFDLKQGMNVLRYMPELGVNLWPDLEKAILRALVKAG